MKLFQTDLKKKLLKGDSQNKIKSFIVNNLMAFSTFTMLLNQQPLSSTKTFLSLQNKTLYY